MRHIMVMNAKGGCGKSTIATSIASYYATEGYDVVLADYDPQASSMDWLERRPEKAAPIHGIAAHKEGLTHMPRSADLIVIDAPARVHGKEVTALTRRAETIVIPVLPSSIDIAASKRFIEELRHVGRIQRRQSKLALVANRVRENTLIFEDLDEFLEKQRVPYVAALREAQNYIRAYSRGLGIFELPEYLAWPDWDCWDPLLEWLDSRRSRP